MVLRKLMIFLVAAALIFIPAGSGVMAQSGFDQEKISPDLAMAGDILFVRPIGIVGTAIGTVLFIVSVPFSAAGGNTEQAFKKMVAEPAEFTFKRPIGVFPDKDQTP
jgi:hypothetical protein